MNCFGCFGLVSVEAANAFAGVGGSKIGVHPGGEVRPLSFARGKIADRGEHFAGQVASRKGVENFVDAGDRVRRFSPANG